MWKASRSNGSNETVSDNKGCEKSFERSEDLRQEELENRKSSESWQEVTL